MRSLIEQPRFALAVDTTESVAEDPADAPEPIEDPDEDTLSVPELLSVLIERGGSDLHLMAGSPPFIRICGELERLDRFPPLLPEAVRTMVYAILPAKMRERFEQELELDMSYALPGKARFRVNVYQQRDVVGAAFRLIPCEIKTVEELGLPPVVGDLARLPRGFVVVTGPTGSGKSTTLAAMVDVVNEERAAHVMTIEDPIEFLHKNKRSAVNQREVGQDTHGFARAAKYVLRQDPDVILIGEMRDLETISTALRCRDGPPGLRDAAHAGRAAVDRSHHRRVPSGAAAAGTGPALQHPEGHRQPAARRRRRMVRGRAVAAEVLVVTPAVRHLIRIGKVPQILGDDADGRAFGMPRSTGARAPRGRGGSRSRRRWIVATTRWSCSGSSEGPSRILAAAAEAGVGNAVQRHGLRAIASTVGRRGQRRPGPG